MDLRSTLAGSMMEGFLPQGWDLERVDACCAVEPGALAEPQGWWDPGFRPETCATVADLDVLMGHEIARSIQASRAAKRPLALILPVGPMGMYRWAVRFLHEWDVACDHVHGFNMDEWSDRDGQTLPGEALGSFRRAMEGAWYGPLAASGRAIPEAQRWFATPDLLPRYADRIAELRAEGAELVVVYGIGRVCHIAFWEPHFAAEFPNFADWRRQTHKLGAALHPLTVEQNALTSFRSRTTLVPAFANTIGPGLFLDADRMIGGADGVFGRGMQWQGASLRMTLRYGPDPWVPSSFVPTRPGRLFYLDELAGPLVPDLN